MTGAEPSSEDHRTSSEKISGEDPVNKPSVVRKLPLWQGATLSLVAIDSPKWPCLPIKEVNKLQKLKYLNLSE